MFQLQVKQLKAFHSPPGTFFPALQHGVMTESVSEAQSVKLWHVFSQVGSEFIAGDDQHVLTKTSCCSLLQSFISI